MQMMMAWTIFFSILAVTICLFTAYMILKLPKISAKFERWPNVASKIVLSLAIVSTVALVAYPVTMELISKEALQHGAEMESIEQAPVSAVLYAISHSPIDESESLPETSLTKSACIMFRFDCKSCQSVTEQLEQWASTRAYPVRFVSSRTDNGRALVEKSGLYEVPCVIAVNQDNEMRVFYPTGESDGELDYAELEKADNWIHGLYDQLD